MLYFLIEDYADEWVTKMMFHYRWAIQEDVDHAGRIMPRWHLGISDEEAGAFAAEFGPRQVERLWVVGSNETTASLIEESYRRLLGLLEALLRTQPFVMGARPGSARAGGSRCASRARRSAAWTARRCGPGGSASAASS